MDQPNWYGGRIQQVVRLEEANDGFRLTLAKMEMRKSCRTARFLGSRRMLQVSIPKEVANNRADDVRLFFTQKFVLCGRVFVSFLSKDKKIFLMEIPEDYERAARVRGDERRITLMDFIAWHNSMERNGQQVRSPARPFAALAHIHAYRAASRKVGYPLRSRLLHLGACVAHSPRLCLP